MKPVSKGCKEILDRFGSRTTRTTLRQLFVSSKGKGIYSKGIYNGTDQQKLEARCLDPGLVPRKQSE